MRCSRSSRATWPAIVKSEILEALPLSEQGAKTEVPLRSIATATALSMQSGAFVAPRSRIDVPSVELFPDSERKSTLVNFVPIGGQSRQNRRFRGTAYVIPTRSSPAASR
jgi:hypothetical protein